MRQRELPTKALFEQLASGAWAFFPHGAMCRGYVLPSEKECERLEHELATVHLTLLFVALGSLSFGLGGTGGVAAALLLRELWIHWRVRRLPVARAQIDVGSGQRWALTLAIMLLAACFVLMGAALHSVGAREYALFFMAWALGILVCSAYLHRRTQPPPLA